MTKLIRVIDMETTGFPPSAGIIELGWTDVHATFDTDENGKIFLADHSVSMWQSELTNPGMPIETAAKAEHHIIEEDLIGRRHPQEVLQELIPGVDYFVSHNVKFEQEFFQPPVPWICTLKLAYRLCPNAPNHKNQTLRYFLNTPVNRRFAQPSHRAGPDSYVTAHTLAKFLTANIPLETFVRWTEEPARFPRCPIGSKEKGKLWSEVDMGFLLWCTRQPAMDPDILANVKLELNKRRGQV